MTKEERKDGGYDMLLLIQVRNNENKYEVQERGTYQIVRKRGWSAREVKVASGGSVTRGGGRR